MMTVTVMLTARMVRRTRRRRRWHGRRRCRLRRSRQSISGAASSVLALITATVQEEGLRLVAQEALGTLFGFELRAKAEPAPEAAPEAEGAPLKKEFPEVLRILEAHAGRLYSIFMRFDTNHDGIIRQGEFFRGVQALDASVTEEQLNWLYSHFDKDGSGKILFVEFQSVLHAH